MLQRLVISATESARLGRYADPRVASVGVYIDAWVQRGLIGAEEAAAFKEAERKASETLGLNRRELGGPRAELEARPRGARGVSARRGVGSPHGNTLREAAERADRAYAEGQALGGQADGGGSARGVPVPAVRGGSDRGSGVRADAHDDAQRAGSSGPARRASGGAVGSGRRTAVRAGELAGGVPESGPESSRGGRASDRAARARRGGP